MRFGSGRPWFIAVVMAVMLRVALPLFAGTSVPPGGAWPSKTPAAWRKGVIPLEDAPEE